MLTTTRRASGRRLRQLLLVGLVFASFSAFSLAARADGVPGMSVAWSAPAQCPEASEFRTGVERFLGKSQIARDAKQIRISAVVSQSSDGGFDVSLEVTTEHGPRRRRLAHRDCQELTEAAALVAALAIDPKLALPEPQGATPAVPPNPSDAEAVAEKAAGTEVANAPEPVGQPETTQDAPPLAPGPKPPTRNTDAPITHTPQSPFHPALLAFGAAGSGPLPGVGVGLGGHASAGTTHVRLAVRGIYWFPRFQPIQAQGDGLGSFGADLSAWGVSLRACGLPRPRAVTLSFCFGPELGQVRGSGYRLESSQTARVRWTALDAEVAASFQASSGLMTQLGVELGKSLEMPKFGVREDGIEHQVYQAPGWLIQVYAGFGVFAGPTK